MSTHLGVSLHMHLGHDQGAQPCLGTRRYLAEFSPAYLSHLKNRCTNMLKRAAFCFSSYGLSLRGN